MARPTCSCMGHWRGRDRQRRGLHAVAWIIGEAETGNGEADMQLHGSLARPRQTKERPTCSCMDHWRGRNRQWRRPTCSCMDHWRGRNRQWRGRHAVAWIIGEAETGNGEADMQLHGLHLHGSLARPRPRQTKARPTKALGCKARTGRNGRGRGKRVFRVYGF